jgi:hypothetical protein
MFKFIQSNKYVVECLCCICLVHHSILIKRGGVMSCEILDRVRVMVFNATSQQYFSYIVEVSFIVG